MSHLNLVSTSSFNQDYPDILNDPSTPLKVVECYFLLRDNEFHTLHYIVTHVLKDSFSAEEIGEAMKIYMLP